MIVLYDKSGDRKEVHDIDASAWIANGWSTKPPVMLPEDTQSEKETAAKPSKEESEKDDSAIVNINTATQVEIAKVLPKIGRAKAKEIIESRPIKDIGDLQALMPNLDWDALKEFIAF